MAEQKEKSTFEKILDFGVTTGVPLARQLIFGGSQASEAELAEEQLYYDRLNGSGAPDRRGYMNAARTREQFLFGAPATSGNGPVNPASPLNTGNLIALVVAGLIVWFITKKL